MKRDKKGDVGVMFFYITIIILAIIVLVVMLVTSNKILDGVMVVGKRIAHSLLQVVGK